MAVPRPRRSVLYVPGSNQRALEKARELPADVLILDLEDAVAPEAKDAARERVAALVAGGAYRPREVVVRINHAWSAWGAADIEAVALCGADALLVPKVETAEDIFTVGRALSGLGAPAELAIWAMMETARAVVAAAEIAAAVDDEAGRRLAALVVGTNDLARETRVAPAGDRRFLLPWLMGFVAAARANGLAILDGVHADLDDLDGFAAECAAGRAMGMDGKTLVHPGQIAPANAAFAPTPDEIAWAERVLAAFAAPAAAGQGAIRLDGRLVERLHLDIARRTLALAAAIAALVADSGGKG